MKIAPLAQGTGVPSNTQTGSISSDAKTRAIAIAQGQTPPEVQESTGNPQADKALKKIKMKTQVSPDRDISPIIEQNVQETASNNPETHSNEATQEVETKPLSPQFAALAKAKRALQLERAQLEKEKAELGVKPSFNPEEFISKADLKSKPLSVLTEAGVTYDQLTEALLNGSGPNPEVLALKAELKALKEEITGQLSERDKLAEQQVLNQIDRDIASEVASSETYAAIRQAKAQADVRELIHRTWQKSNEILDVKEACDLVEKQIREEALPFVDLLRPQQQAQPQAQPVQKPQTKVMKTLTNRDGAAPVTDRRSRALAAFYGQLKR